MLCLLAATKTISVLDYLELSRIFPKLNLGEIRGILTEGSSGPNGNSKKSPRTDKTDVNDNGGPEKEESNEN